jgi:hypothetical protein
MNLMDCIQQGESKSSLSSCISRIQRSCKARGLNGPRIRKKGDFVDVECYQPVPDTGIGVPDSAEIMPDTDEYVPDTAQKVPDTDNTAWLCWNCGTSSARPMKKHTTAFPNWHDMLVALI